jgi:hypothetical protein
MYFVLFLFSEKCEAGQKLDDKGACEDCQVDSYQAEELPDSTTQCMPCTVGMGTMNPKSSKQDKCVGKLCLRNSFMEVIVCIQF